MKSARTTGNLCLARDVRTAAFTPLRVGALPSAAPVLVDRPGKAHNATSRASAFTLAEVLAALLFMAIVVPVAMEGLHIASLAGAVAQRKSEAARIAQRVLNESLITTNWSQSLQSGTTIEGQRQFRWTLRSDPWTQDPAQNVVKQLSVEVLFTAQNREYSVKLTTLVDSSLLMGVGGSM